MTTTMQVRATLPKTLLNGRMQTVVNPAFPGIDFLIKDEDLTKLSEFLAEKVAKTNEVLGVRTWTDHVHTAQVDEPDSTVARLLMRVTYATPMRTVEHTNLLLLEVTAIGTDRDFRYRRLEAEAMQTLKEVLAANPVFRARCDEVEADLLKMRPDPVRLETIRTEAVNALVARMTQAARDRAAQDVRKGTAIKIVRGRKIPVGTTGVAFWKGSGAYGQRVGFKDAAGNTLWTAATNVEAVYDDAAVVAAALAEAKAEYAKELAAIFGPARA